MPAQTDDATQKLRGLLRSVIRQSAPARPLSTRDSDPRLHVRYGRVLPALVVPLRGDVPAVEQATFCISGDLSAKGISLVHDLDLPYESMVIGLWRNPERQPPQDGDDPILVLGKKCASNSLGGGFWQTGIEFKTRYADQAHLGELREMAKALLPPEGSAEVDF